MKMPPLSEQNRSLERKVVTVLSCGVAGPLEGDIAASLWDAFVPQAVTILQIMGASVHVGAANIITAEFASCEMSETDAERAVLAAFDLLSAKRENSGSTEFNLSIGIASGLIWAKVPETGPGAAGDFSNIVAKQASALQELSSPGRVYITEATRNFVKGLFEYADEKPLILRNFAEPVHAFAVARPNEAENRFEALRSQRLRLFGRERELTHLTQLWKLACVGKAQFVFVTGEQGIGKSRLVSEAERRISPMPSARLRLFGSPNHRNSVLYPFVRLIERLCRFDRSDPVTVRRAKLEDFLASLGAGWVEKKSLLGSLLGLVSDGSELPPGTSTRKHRELVLQALFGLVEALSRQGPLLMIFEDLQWADPTSRDLVEALVKQPGSLPLMLIAVARHEILPPWQDREAVSTIALAPLEPPETAAFISLVSRSHGLPASVHGYLVECTGGIPLFVEELTKVFIETGSSLEPGAQESGTLRASLAALPVSIHAALLTRLERLGGGKAVARVASVLGRRFPHKLLEGVSEFHSEELNLGLARLIDAGLILRRGTGPGASYMFKHALVQEAAYSTLSPGDKRILHLRAARLLQAFEKQQAIEPEATAQHLTEGGEYDEAARLWHLAGQRAAARSANLEAIEHLKTGLKCLRRVDASGSRDTRERHMLMGLGPALMAVHGYSASESQNAFERAAQLAGEAAPIPERLHILCGLWNVRHGRSELPAALSLAERFLDLAQSAGAGLTLGHCMMGQTLAAMGDFKPAQSHFLYVIEQYRSQESGPERVPFAADELILALTYMGRVLWALGYPDQAAAATEEALWRAQNGADAVSVAIAHVGQLYLATHGANIEELAAKIGEAVAHCSRYGLYLFEHWMLFNRGALLVRQGQASAGIELMRSAIAAADARQSRQFRVFQLSCIAEAYLRCEAHGQALAVADEAALLAEKTCERMSEAGLRRIRADILFELGRRGDGRRELETALRLARRQSTRLEELRIATAMVRHSAGVEDAEAAGRALREVYATFGEGRGLPDLRAARDQLEHLGLSSR
jgi:tetratricopeptide (TPR) repeat protein